uniref:Uncharacterized protein n=1 Tax=Strigamia maritima TaxID=126957 RepID=T1IU38_STRMM
MSTHGPQYGLSAQVAGKFFDRSINLKLQLTPTSNLNKGRNKSLEFGKSIYGQMNCLVLLVCRSLS